MFKENISKNGKIFKLDRMKHPVSEAMRQAMIVAMSNKGMNHAELAKAVGRGNPWVTKLLKGDTLMIQESVMHQIETALGISFFSANAGETRSPLAQEIATLIDLDPQFARITVAVRELLIDASKAATLPVVSQSSLIKIGAAVTRIVHAWEEGNDPHYAKIGAETLDYLRKFYSKTKR